MKVFRSKYYRSWSLGEEMDEVRKNVYIALFS